MKLKIAIICPGCGIIPRGIERHCEELYLRLSKKHEITVFSLTKSNWTYNIELKDLSKKGFNRRDVLFFSIKTFYTLLKNKMEFDIILNFSGREASLFCKLYKLLTKTPFISNPQGMPLKTELLLGADAFICQTPYIERKYREFKNGNYYLIPNGVDLKNFRPTRPRGIQELKAVSTQENIKLEHPIVLSTSALEKRKGIDKLIEAMELTKGSLLICNTGSEKENIIIKGKNLLGNRFIYLGVVPYERLPKLYSSCDIFALPSLEEGFGNVLLEAMACNKPVVSQDDESRRWIVGDAGVLTDVTDTEKLAEAIEKAYKTDFKNKPRKQAEKFDWDEIAGMYERLLYNLHLKK